MNSTNLGCFSNFFQQQKQDIFFKKKKKKIYLRSFKQSLGFQMKPPEVLNRTRQFRRTWSFKSTIQTQF